MNGNQPGCLIRDAQEVTGPPDMIRLQQTWQHSIGFQRQFGSTISVEVDYVYSKGSDEKDVIDNVNLSYNPATGANYPFSDGGGRSPSGAS